MKRFLVTGVSILALSAASGAYGNDSDLTQTGNDNSATISQIIGSESSSDVTQSGNDNVAEVTQEVVPAGISAFNVPANDSIIDQIGDNSRATVRQTSSDPGSAPGNAALISQNSSNVLQLNRGVALNARIVQGAPGAGTVNNYAEINQGGNFTNMSALDDSGSGVTARSRQFGSENTSTINQQILDQNADPSTRALVDQTGGSNISNVLQQGAQQFTDVDQTGDNNVSDVMQGNNNNGHPATAIVLQTGDDNESYIDQVAQNVTATVTQTGNQNASDIDQTGGSRFSDATVLQTGDLNNSTIAQGTNGRRSTATVTQTGNTSDSVITQNNVRADAIVEQGPGSDNDSTITQSMGMDVMAMVTQTGSGNLSRITQQGDNQMAMVIQASSGNESAITQMGMNNTATHSQIVTDGNTATTNQNGTGNIATVNQ